MTRLEPFFYRNLKLIRRIIQYGTVLFIIAVPIFNRFGFQSVRGTFYSISVGNLDLMDPALMFQYILLSKEFHFSILLAGGILLIPAVLFGKVFCGWICPYNLLAEYTDEIRKIVRPKTICLNNKNPKPQNYWFVFGTIVTIIAVSGIPVITFISFPGLISAQIADYVFFGAVGFELLLIVLVVLLEIFVAPRFWCKYACPVGATLALIRKKNTLTVSFDPKICKNNCPVDRHNTVICNAACPMQLNPRSKGLYPYCINCGACIEACYNKGGKALNFTFHPKEKMKPVRNINRNQED